LKKESEAYRQQFGRLEEKFAAERKKLFEHIQAEAQGVLRDWKASRLTHKQALKSLSRLRADLQQNGHAGGVTDQGAVAQVSAVASLAPGQMVFYRPWGKKGRVLELDGRRERVRIDFSGVTMWTDLAELSDLASENAAGSGGAKSGPKNGGKTGDPAKPGAPGGAVVANVERSSAYRLDLRGKRADFALSELAQYIDSAILNGRDLVEIIHGRGTGALRREVHAYLKDNPAIKSYALAPEDQGGDGVTLAELK
jgi:DNA mismatch repair protein MutS2